MSPLQTTDLIEEASLLDTLDLVSLLQGRAELQPHETAYVFLDEGESKRGRLSFSDLDRRARSIAACLQNSGIAGQQARALLLYPPGLDYIEAFFGCLYAGVIAVPAYPPSGRHRQRLQAIFRDASPALVMTVTELRDRFAAGAESSLGQGAISWLATDELDTGEADAWTPFAADPDSLAFLQYTSGSTGNPRGVMISHANLLVNQALIRQSFQHSKHSTLVGWLPLYHDMGLIGNVLQPLYVGSTAYLMSPLAFLEKPFRWLQAISTYRARTSGGPNFAYDLCARKITPEQKRDLDLSCWTVAFSGAEPVRATTLDRFAAAFADCGFRRENFFPCYGLAEATLVVSAPTRGKSPALRRADRNALWANRIAEATTGAALALVGCGHTWPGHEVCVVHPETAVPCADGEIGEIWAAGPSMAKGYWNQPKESVLVFQAQLAGEETGRFLRTGDLGFLEHGELFVTGRLKDLIIIAGRNHYPQDFERVLDEQVGALRPGSSAAFSVAVDDEEALVIVAEPQRVELQLLRERGPHIVFEQIRESLADECEIAPAEIVLVQPGSIPKTSSGKIRRSACRQDYLSGRLSILARTGGEPASSAPVGAPPGNEKGHPLLREALSLLAPPQRIGLIARFLISNTARLLRIPDSDLSENTRIMTSGLDSLRALELKHALDVLLGADIPLPLLLADMTFGQIAEALNCFADANGEAHTIEDTECRATHDLSHSQQAMWAVHQMDPSGVASNLHLALRIKGRVDSRTLNRSLDYLLERHPVLRTVYQEESEGVVQTLRPLTSIKDYFSIVNAEGWAEDKLQKDLGGQAVRPFDLANGPVLRTTLYRHADDSVTLLFCAHHIAMDLWSLLIFLKELEEVYRAQPTPNLPRIAANYQNFVAWQRQYLDSQASDPDWAYWRSHLAGDLPVLAFPTDRPRPPAPTNRGSAFRLQLDAELTGGLKTVARAHGATLFMALLAAYKILLYRYTHQRDIIVGSVSSGRSQRRFAPVVGNFVNPLALRTKLRPEQPFSDYLGEVRNCVTGALAHQYFPFSVLVDRLQPKRIVGQWPIFQTWFVLQQAQADVASGYAQLALGESSAPLPFGEWEVEGLALDDRVERFDLKLMAAETGQGVVLSFQYCRDLFCEETIARLAGHFQSLVEAIVAAPQTSVAALPLLDEKETRQQLAALHGIEEAGFLANCVHHIFTEWVRKTPEATALVCTDHRLTYAELDSRANQLAHFLRSKGVDRNVPVGLCVTRSAETIIAILGILKAGGAYIPIELDLPSIRIAGMLRDARAKVLLCRQGWFERSGIAGAEPIFLDSQQVAIDAQPNDTPTVRNSPLDLAYIIFTSGSTGLPKGVAIAHQSLANYTKAILARLPAERELHFGLVSTLAADLGNTVLLPALSGGGCLHVLTYDEATDPRLFSAYLARHPIDVLKIVPSHYNALVRPGAETKLLPRKALIFGGEALSSTLAKRVLSVAKPPQVFNHYGPTEATVGALMLPLSADDLHAGGPSAVPIGRPIENMRAFILGPDLAFQPQGISGEICLGGVGLACGYLGRPDLTAEQFVPDPFATRPGERLYRTGDLGRVTRHGDIEFLGRIDQQVKIRGFRIELGEVEARLIDHASVAQAVVVALTDKPGIGRLVAYVVLEKDLAVEEDVMRAHLRQLLPEYMVPSVFIFLDAIPVTQNGKIDRERLPIPNLDIAPPQIYRAPRNEIEASLADIYASLLHNDRIGIDDNFFALGGDSILSIQAAGRAHSAGLNVSPRHIFKHQSIAELSTAIASLPVAATPLSPAIASGEDFPLSNLSRSELDKLTKSISGIEDIYPLTPLQEGLLFHTLSQPNTGVYVMQHRYWIYGEIDVSVFRAAWQSIIDAHPIFRTAFVWDGFSRSQQVVRWQVELPFDYLDLRQSTQAEQDKQLDDLLTEERRVGFDPNKAPLVRIRLVHLGDHRYLLIRSHHHILFDAWCTSLILSELQSNYGALIKGQDPPRRSGLGFRDYIAWLQRQDYGAAEPFWRQYLEGFSEPTPLVASHSSEVKPEDKDCVEDLVLYLSEEDTAELRTLAQRYQVTPNTFAQAALALLLAQYTSHRDVLFGVTVAGRPAELRGVESILGLFINGLPLRVTADPRQSLPSFLRTVLEQNYAIRDYEYVSLTQVQNWSEIPRGVELFQYLLTFENAPVDSALLESRGDWWFTDCWHRTHTNYPVTFVVIPGPRLHLQVTYANTHFDRASAERMLVHYRRLLEGMIRRPEARLGELGLLGEDECHCVLEEWNATAHAYAEPRDIIGRFEAQVLRSPEAVAASCGGLTLGYHALNERANRFAHALIKEGAGPDCVVALLDERGLDFLAMMLAIFKAGAAYLPLDPAHPDGRIAQVLAESQVGLLFAGAACRDRAEAIVAAMSEPKLRLLDLAALEAREDRRHNPHRRHGPQNLAFVIYTSGSTGKPKGAMVEHQGMFNNLITKVPALELTALDVIAQTASQCFDISVWQFLTALTLGARVEIFPDAISHDPPRLLDEIAACGVTVLEAVPSMIRALLDASEAGAALAGLRWLLPCGEAFAPELCRRFMDRHPQVRLLNAYGPAECSDDVSYYPILTPPDGNDLSVPIGRPVDNTRLYLLNRWLEPAPAGVPGEICVGGVQVGRGYLNRPDLTAAAFLPDPFGPPGARFYLTGDLGRYRADGVIEFLGRVDHQVKIRGHRIEPGEVEACLMTHPKIQQACVVAREVSKGIYRLVAYIVGTPLEVRVLREHLLQTLPDYMVPSAFAFVDTVPLTPNGKVDRRRLPDLGFAQQLAHRYVAPRNATEEILSQIWAEVLQVERVGVEDNFFELGGHSLLSIQVRSKIRTSFDVELPLGSLFDAPTISELAKRIEEFLVVDLEALSEEEALSIRKQMAE